MLSNHRVLAIPILAVPTPIAESKTEQLTASAQLIMSAIHSVLAVRNAFSTLTVLEIRVALVIDVSILVRERAASMPIVGSPTTFPSAVVKNRIPEILTGHVVLSL